MAQEPAFGRRAGAVPAAPIAPPLVERPLPTLADLGFTPSDDRAEVRDYMQGLRQRRFAGRGGWRWVAGLCFGVNTVLGLLDVGAIGWLFTGAGLAALLYSFRRRTEPAAAARETP
jgi:hypothetical protein